MFLLEGSMKIAHMVLDQLEFDYLGQSRWEICVGL
jgi:hypothetical protein